MTRKAAFLLIAFAALCAPAALASKHVLSLGASAQYAGAFENGGFDMRKGRISISASAEFAPHGGFASARAEGGVSLLNGIRFPLSLGAEFRLTPKGSAADVRLGAEATMSFSAGGMALAPTAHLRIGFRLSDLIAAEIAARGGYRIAATGDLEQESPWHLSAGIGIRFDLGVGASDADAERRFDGVYYQDWGDKVSYIVYSEAGGAKPSEDEAEEETVVMTRSELDELLEAQRNENAANDLLAALESAPAEKGDSGQMIRRNTEESLVDVEGRSSFFGAMTRYAYRRNKIFIVYCTMRNITDIRLKDTEEIIDIKVGDPTGNWTWEACDNFDDGKPSHHVIFRPAQANIRTDCEIYTTERTYMLKLVSTGDNTWQPAVEWTYAAEEKGETPAGGKPEGGAFRTAELIAGCVFNYEMSGNAFWKPARTFSDKSKTYIQFRNSFLSDSVAPAVVLRNTETGKETNINVTVKGITYILPIVLGAGQELLLVYEGDVVRIRRERR